MCVHYWKLEPSCSAVDGKIKGKCSKCGEEAEFLDWSGITSEEYLNSLSARTRGRINRLANYENPPVTLSPKVKCPLAR